ncbi:tuftelin-interacting protein 11 isoform X2 [Lingula anatina]|uniref:Tuftelin-interacting protein 11 isoform X2 n=1 Tax=Lingula anatina TaxID=7574 RepID=A0A1S3JNS8_LINAN|nr:tuftelin-interacting protein 11 isoform X2 [Lingula anatina]|eukprot:XP_013412007.1 tuftelin-interacting protein 11 isoform X2 [Lingula anatina]
MSSPEVERFEVTDEDLLNEMDPYRKRFRMSKNQAIYGVWADDSDEEGQPGTSREGRKKKKDYTAPIGFVSGGIKRGSKVEKEDDDEEEDEDEDVAMPSNSFQSAMAGGRKRGGYKGKKGPYKPGEEHFGHWEKSTKGIGGKLLAKMGYVPGKGLGKNLQGISTPVTAKKRDGKAAIGFYGSERTERSLQDFPAQVDSEEEEEKEFRQQLHQWRKGGGEADKKKKPKYLYKTAAEVIEKGGPKGGKKKSAMPSHLSNVKVIDMTSKEQRVLTGYHAISNRHDRPDSDEEERPVVQPQQKAFDVPELLHNLNLLVDMAEEDIIQNDRTLKYEKDVVVNMTYEKESLKEVCDQEEKQVKRLQDVLELVESCEARMQDGASNPLSLEECAEVFRKLQAEYYEEYKMYDLSNLAVGMVFPMVKKYFSGWKPLEQPSFGLDTMQLWKAILEDSNRQFGQTDGMDPYQRLVWEAWMPTIRSTIANDWSVRSPDPLITVLENWLPLLPPWVMQNIQDQLVMPKLTSEVEAWNPLTDTMPIHAWIHPWLPLIGDKLETLYAPIRFKLANALKNWHPSDPSAKMILEPWRKVFQQGHLDAFLAKNILPKLNLCMQEFVINPHNQHLDGWTWVMSWQDIMPLQHQVSLLERHFFPKWLTVLCTWLNSHPNYDEVTKWYMGWKSMFTTDLLANGAIKEQFSRALEIMNRAVSGNPYQPGARENIAYLTHTERRRDFESKATQDRRSMEEYEAVQSSQTVPSSFKDLVERKAEENGLLFMPVPNKTYEAKQVYKFGSVQVYMDRSVIFMQEGMNWVPVSIQGLIDKGRAGS